MTTPKDKDKPGRHERMLAAYGFGLFALPRYAEVKGKGWHVRHHLPSMSEGYLTQSFVEGNRFVLYEGRRPWMSTGLFEVESHAWHVQAAHGLVVVAGLGMGMYAYAVSQKPDVTQVVIVERDPRVAEILEQAVGFSQWPGRGKIQLLMADALDPDLPAQLALFTGGKTADYFYADIWPVAPDASAPSQMLAMAGRLAPAAAGWWGQEFNFGRWCLETGTKPDEAALRGYFAAYGVTAPVTPGYLAFCRDLLAANRAYLTPRRAVSGGFWSRLFRR
ncbi:MAG TPA: hypothetical protein VM661_17410 [Candidatus Sulfotelmatobacter sp.]|jgi:hypothetical protein|nr:hypothetical protein [Candidatus Sulfotelmatobacter sp.]